MVDDAPTFGPWKAVRKLGEGGVCAVWLARHTLTEEEAAIKVLVDANEENISRFVDEAEMLMQITHPNVLSVHHVDPEARPPWLVMDLLHGRDLDARLEQGPMPPREAARLIATVADGLAVVHGIGVRHRDIKPGNIMIDADGEAKLIDFGIARRIHDTRRTQQGMVVGTAAYLPPEVWGGDNPQQAQDTEAADVFALGQTLCELLAGRAVYEREGDTTLLVAILRDKLERTALDPRDWAPDVPEGLARIVMDATAQDPDERIRSASALRARLERWLDASAAPVAPSLPPTERASGAAVMSAGASLIAMGLLFAGTLLGLAGLWVARPTAPRVADPDAVHAALVEQSEAFVPCATGDEATVTATWVVHDGTTWHASADPSVAGATPTACVLAALEAMTWPEGTLAVSAPIALR